MSKGPRNMSHQAMRKILKTMPEFLIRQLIEYMEITGREKQIAEMTYLQHKDIQSICDELHIASKVTYHSDLNSFLEKAEKTLPHMKLNIL